MSLTSHLRNPNSPLTRWFEDNSNPAAVEAYVQAHNYSMMAVDGLIKPEGTVIFPLVGTAVTYAMRWYLKPMDSKLFSKTVASLARGPLEIPESFMKSLFEAGETDLRARAVACVVFGIMDKFAREGRFDDVGVRLIRTTRQLESGETRKLASGLDSLALATIKGKTLVVETSQMQLLNDTIQDVYNLMLTFDSVWSPHGALIGQFHVNPTFTLSRHVGGADAQMIMGDVLIDIRTTIKQAPFDKTNFFQQIGYVLLDSEDKYQIKRLAWYYTRQQTLFMYPVDQIISQLADKRHRLSAVLNSQMLGSGR